MSRNTFIVTQSYIYKQKLPFHYIAATCRVYSMHLILIVQLKVEKMITFYFVNITTNDDEVRCKVAYS